MATRSLDLPSGVSTSALRALLDETCRHEDVLRAILRRFEDRYPWPLMKLEARLARGEGPEHGKTRSSGATPRKHCSARC